MQRPLTLLVLALALAACSAGEIGDTLENVARSACEAAGNCSNSCPDGGTAHGPGYRCP